MFTRFQTATATHVLDAPLIKIPPETPGAMFLGALGGAYEFEEEHLCSRVLQFATDLEGALQQRDLSTRAGVPNFLAGLRSVIQFLQSASEPTVRLYSYERAPSLEELVEAFCQGGGANDWALEELGKKGEKGRKDLLALLKKENDKQRILSAISLLSILYRDDSTRSAVQNFIDTCEAHIGKDAAVLLEAYSSSSQQSPT